ncbi:MAG: hypothetical protein DHS20C02_09630 [Micavibrio sp.]|nr:MAG: hypothetical protein DHS20C02_09630 [Micavibrio sp.]
MPLIKLQSDQDNRLLYEGDFPTVTACVEQAVSEQIDLKNVNLHNANLINANLDEAQLQNANLSGANLSGANLSEAHLKGANMDGAALYNTCFCYSNLSYCDFGNSAFGGTDIVGCDISESRFSTLSAFTLNFVLARNMAGCVFRDPSGTLCSMSRAPVVIHGLQNGPLVLMDYHVKIGHAVKSYHEWLSLITGHYSQLSQTACSTDD